MTADAAFPLRRGDTGLAATIANALARASFTEAAILERLRIDALDIVDLPRFRSFADRAGDADLLDLFIRLFLFGHAVDRSVAGTHLAPAEIDAFLQSDLMRPLDPADAGGDRLYSPVRMVPMPMRNEAGRHLMLVGDRTDHPDGTLVKAFSDIVFSGYNPLTRQFLHLLPRYRPATVLDLCAGSGVAGLFLAASGSRATVADIAERSVHFARFNGWLNGFPDLEAVCGDLYAPADRRFDCIIAHPPYVPAFSQNLTYRDGGEGGDEIVQRVIAGAPDHLNPGGTFHLLCLGVDTVEAPFEQRVRAWLGPAADEFDVVFAVDSVTKTDLIVEQLTQRAGGDAADFRRWREVFGRRHVKEFVYGAVVGRRFTTPGTPMTRRVLMTTSTTDEGFQWLFRWFDWLRGPGGSAKVLGARPVPSPSLQLEVHHRVVDGRFAAEAYWLENGGLPFLARLKTEVWIAALVNELDGTRTAREAFDDARSRQRVPEDVSIDDFERLLCVLIERGCLDLPEATAKA